MDEEADLALLDQHLLKTNSLSQRMTGILSQLDSRLSRLDKTIAPLGLQPLARKAANIDALLLTLSPSSGPSSSSAPGSRGLNGTHPTNPTSTAPSRPSGGRTPSASSSSSSTAPGYSLAPSHPPSTSRLSPIPSAPSTRVPSPSGASPGLDESAIITRGPDIVALSEFFGAYDSVVADLEDMSAALSAGRAGGREQAVRDLGALVERGMEGMMGLLQRVMREGMEGRGRRCDVEEMIERGPPSPPIYLPPLPALSPLTTYLSSLLHRLGPNSATRSHTDSIVSAGLARVATERGEWIGRGMEGVLGGVEDARGEQETARAAIRVWEGLVGVMEAETLLYTTLFSASSTHPSTSASPPSPSTALPTPPLLPLTLSTPLTLATSALSALLSQIRRALSSNAGLALELYTAFQGFAPEWEEGAGKCLGMMPGSIPSSTSGTTSGSASASDTDLLRALDQPLRDLRQLCSRSFPEMLVDIRTGSSSSAGGGGAGGTSSAVADTTYTTLTFLEALPRWQRAVEDMLGQSRAERSWLMGSKEAPSPARSAAEEGGVVNLYVADVLGTLLIHLRTRSESMRKPAGYTFLLNNVSHIRNTTSSFHSDIIGPAAEDMLNQAFRDAKSQFLTPFAALTALLAPSGSSSGGSSSALSRLPLSHGAGSSLSSASTAFWDRLAELEREMKDHPLSRVEPEMRERMGREVWEVVGRGWEGWERRVGREGKGESGKYLRGGTDELRSRVAAMFR